ncbi:hypothetical protein LPJGGPFB_01612 [Ensifer adhaerens]|uniref:Uncharacterized protein n=1 Tax=Ensifer adhaerens TaxID=106592 RepID=A0ACC5T3N4_ENSAD|nr:hypothetical protein [Ensifer adhaerens]MBP1875516.1 hypothetical protein [Ensifer adhaerens]NRP18381.1 hypothetical protein [Ensifer adhaerens]
MKSPVPIVERSILIFAVWAVLGFLGLGIFLEGLKQDSWLLSAAGVAVIVLAFVAHIIVNGVFDTGFTPGETALGIGAYGVLGLVFVAGAVGGSLTMTNYYSGLTLFGVLAAGFLAYLLTRHGLRGAFSRFHIKPMTEREPSK